jgi:hypothetical protein
MTLNEMEKKDSLKAIDKIVDASEAVERARRMCRNVPGFDLETNAELGEVSARLMRIAQGVEQRFNESA